MPQLEIVVLSADKLPNVQTFGDIDPYCQVSFEDKTFSTKHVDNSTAPTWNETFKFHVADPGTSQIHLRVWNKNTASDDFLGEAHIGIAGLHRGLPVERLVLLRNCKSNAEVSVRLTALDFGDFPPAAGGASPPPVQQYPPAAGYGAPQQQQQQQQYAGGPPPPPMGPPPGGDFGGAPPPFQAPLGGYAPPQPAAHPAPQHKPHRHGSSSFGLEDGITIEIVPKHNTDLRLDVVAGGATNGTKIHVWQQNHSPAQRFLVRRRPNGAFGLHPLCAPTHALDNDRGQHRQVQIWEASNGNANQDWVAVDQGQGWHMLVNGATGDALDVAGKGGQGVAIITWAKHGKSNQQYRFYRV